MTPSSLRRWAVVTPSSLRRWAVVTPSSLRRWAVVTPSSLRRYRFIEAVCIKRPDHPGFHTEGGAWNFPPRNLEIEYGYYCGAINICCLIYIHLFVFMYCGYM